MNDPILDEIRAIRDSHAAAFNYDLDAIFNDIKDQEKKAGYKFVDGIAPSPDFVSASGELGPTADSPIVAPNP